ncbi:MAG TPA: hypothetical protein VE130_10560 [Nitrososphaeraceae archaeon]|jgi:hypothetical protein|nr:hypothetical protein [Nitrososphaeraceae archaeon]
MSKRKIMTEYSGDSMDYGKVVTLTATNNLDKNLFTVITGKK